MALTLDKLARWVLPAVAPGDFFSPWERGTFTAVAEVLLQGCAVPIAAPEVARNVERFLLAGKSRRAWRVRFLLALIELLPLSLKLAPFSRLPLEARDRVVREHFLRGRYLWSLCAQSKHLVYLGAYGSPRAEKAVGFVPVPLRARYRLLSGKLAPEGR